MSHSRRSGQVQAGRMFRGAFRLFLALAHATDIRRLRTLVLCALFVCGCCFLSVCCLLACSLARSLLLGCYCNAPSRLRSAPQSDWDVCNRVARRAGPVPATARMHAHLHWLLACAPRMDGFRAWRPACSGRAANLPSCPSDPSATKVVFQAACNACKFEVPCANAQRLQCWSSVPRVSSQSGP